MFTHCIVDLLLNQRERESLDATLHGVANTVWLTRVGSGHFANAFKIKRCKELASVIGDQPRQSILSCILARLCVRKLKPGLNARTKRFVFINRVTRIHTMH